jgi:protein-S-isoprenylcysteine O-methyltransferase Ste14
MAGLIAVLYGIGAYAVFLVSLLYAIGFVGDLVVPKTIDSGMGDSGAAGPLLESLVVDMMLLCLFAVQHSVMARPGFKRWWTLIVPRSVERSTYVLFASLVLLLLYWQWRPIAAPVWTVEAPLAAAAITAIFWSGWGLLLVSTFMLSHFELFGLKQVFARLFRRELPAPQFHTPLLYRHVRHPIYLSFLLAFWATPSMTVGHLLFALATTFYILIAIQLEERDLIELFGDQYRGYRDRVAMLLPLPGRKIVDRRDG